jgi:hypothetical protein
MQKNLWTVAMIFGLASIAVAQDGGKLAWRGKGKEDPKLAMADAKRQGKPMMLFFTSDG